MAINLPNLDGVSDVDTFIQNYRNSLQEQYDAAVANIENQKRLDEASIMSRANTAGSMYSNFPAREKMKYQTSTYMPALVSARNTYQTGLDKLRSNAVDVSNNIKTIEQAIADLNQYDTSVYYPS